VAYLGRPLNYEDSFGLFLQTPRVALKPAVAHAQGAGIAFGKAKVDGAFFDAVAMSEAEAEEMEFRTNVERSRQAELAKGGGHG
jgi:hypothetical protein